jgi:type IV pilus assembly protein PilA
MMYESHPAEALLGGGGIAGVAAAGIVAAIALPAYQDYTIRAQVSEGLALAAAPKLAVAEYYTANGRAPADLAEAGFGPDMLPIRSNAVQRIDIVDGQIVITYGGAAANPQLRGQTVVLTPYLMDGAVSWVCGYALPSQGAEPIGGTDAGATSLQPKHLPSACRPGAGGRVPVDVNSRVPIAATF